MSFITAESASFHKQPTFQGLSHRIVFYELFPYHFPHYSLKHFSFQDIFAPKYKQYMFKSNNSLIKKKSLYLACF